MFNKKSFLLLVILGFPFVIINFNQVIAIDERSIRQYEIIGLNEEVSKLTKGNSEIVVAIIDSGIDFSHQDLGVHLQWQNPDEIVDNGIDDDNNGYIDDVYGWDFVDNDNTPIPEGNSIDDDQDGEIDELLSHGTSIAGIIAGQGKEISGIVPNIKILNVRLLDDDGHTSGKTLEAWRYVAAFGSKFIKIINFSADVSEQTYEALNQTINKMLYEEKMIIVSAAGNNDGLTPSNKVKLPGLHPDIISVGSINKNLNISSFSMQGEGLDLVAPGEDLFSTVVDNKYSIRISGTSFAAPFVSGAVAFLLSLPKIKQVSIEDIKAFIKNTTTDLGKAGYDSKYGAGLLNMTQLIEALQIESNDVLSGYSIGISTLIIILVLIIYKNIRLKTKRDY